MTSQESSLGIGDPGVQWHATCQKWNLCGHWPSVDDAKMGMGVPTRAAFIRRLPSRLSISEKTSLNASVASPISSSAVIAVRHTASSGHKATWTRVVHQEIRLAVERLTIHAGCAALIPSPVKDF